MTNRVVATAKSPQGEVEIRFLDHFVHLGLQYALYVRLAGSSKWQLVMLTQNAGSIYRSLEKDKLNWSNDVRSI